LPLEFDSQDQTTTEVPRSSAVVTGETVASEIDVVAQREVKQLCAELDVYVARRNKSLSRAAYFVFVSLALMTVLSIPLQIATREASHDRTYIHRHRSLYLIRVLLPMISLAGLPFSFGWLLLSARNRSARLNADRLRAYRSMEASGTLVRLLGMDDGKVRQSADQGLMEIVPFWREAEFAALSGEERAYIRRSIIGFNTVEGRFHPPRPVYPMSPDLAVALCRKVGWFGNQEDLGVLKTIARYPALTSGRRRVQKAAREAIPTLESRLAEQNRPETLLRASTTPEAHAEELLRAASASYATPEEELLRPDL
jgi:hypothetical protein